MPFVSVTCPSGTHEFHYDISTPTDPFATAIDKSRPTILFIHSGYAATETFERQFADPELRQFNLVAIDNLGHGSTRGIIGERRYSPTESAHDLKSVMDALDLPPCHIFGLSLGGSIGLELAVNYPSTVLSLTMCSPLTPTESEDVIAGRMEVYNYWIDTFGESGSGGVENDDPETRKKQHDLLDETLYGAVQLLYNNESTRLTRALGRYGMVRAIDIWCGTPEKVKQSYRACVLWFTSRRPIPPSDLAKIKCPVSIIHCSEDIAYSGENAEAIVDQLREAEVQVDFHAVSGPHFGNVLNAESVNPILRDFVLATSNLDADALSKPEPEFEDSMRTPWTDTLRRMGYDPDANSDADSDFEFEGWFSIPPVVPEQRTKFSGSNPSRCK